MASLVDAVLLVSLKAAKQQKGKFLFKDKITLNISLLLNIL